LTKEVDYGIIKQKIILNLHGGEDSEKAHFYDHNSWIILDVL